MFAEDAGKKELAPIPCRRYLSRVHRLTGFDDSRKTKKRVKRMAAKKETSSTEERPAIDVTNVTGAPSTLLNGGGIKKRERERDRGRESGETCVSPARGRAINRC